MSSALIPDQVIAVTPTLISLYGPGPAIVLQQVFYLTLNADDAVGEDGHEWLPLPISELSSVTGMTTSQVRTAVGTLEDRGALDSRPGEGTDRRKWYRICDDQIQADIDHLAAEWAECPNARSSKPHLLNLAKVSARSSKSSSYRTREEQADEATAPSARNATDEDPPQTTTATNTRSVALDITTGFYDWVKETTGHPPALAFPAVAKIIEAALKADFEVLTIKHGLVRIHGSGRTLTKQGLWNEMTSRPAPVPRPKSKLNGSWVDALTEMQREEHARQQTVTAS